MFKKFLFSILFFSFSSSQAANAADLENTLYLDLKDGRIVIEMFPDKAPNHVTRIKELVRQGFYDGVVFHRVIDGFMAQTGDPTGTGTGGSGKKLKAEFNNTKHVRGTVSMARAGHPDSADSQWFIVFADAPHLNNQYTAWGQVTEGMEFVDNIKRGAPGSGKVTNPDTIVRIQVAADVEKKDKPKDKSSDVKKAPAASDTIKEHKKESSHDEKVAH
jgi:peptidylprolyl isomerase